MWTSQKINRHCNADDSVNAKTAEHIRMLSVITSRILSPELANDVDTTDFVFHTFSDLGVLCCSVIFAINRTRHSLSLIASHDALSKVITFSTVIQDRLTSMVQRYKLLYEMVWLSSVILIISRN